MSLWKRLFGTRRRSPTPDNSSKTAPVRGVTPEFERAVQQASEWYESGPAKREAEMLRVWELRKSQGWKPVYVKGEMALIDTLLEAGGSPEDIANATFKEDWHSLVAKFVGSPE